MNIGVYLLVTLVFLLKYNSFYSLKIVLIWLLIFKISTLGILFRQISMLIKDCELYSIIVCKKYWLKTPYYQKKAFQFQPWHLMKSIPNVHIWNCYIIGSTWFFRNAIRHAWTNANFTFGHIIHNNKILNIFWLSTILQH